MGLENEAIKLGQNRMVMNSYWDFHIKKQNWFFSPNPKLAGATKKPSNFSNWSDWKSLTSSQKSTLSTLGGFHYTASDVKKNKNDLARLKSAYSNWDSRLYSIFWSMAGSNKIWLCNVFVGDAIYAYSKRSFTSANRHYYDPRQIINEQSTLKKRASYKEVEPGDIVVFGKSHVEIITSITKLVFSDDGFCSIGAGRGQRGSSGDGTIRCDSALSFSESRELENDNNTYFYL